MNTRFLSFLLLLFTISTSAYAQNITVRGTVTDNLGDPIINAGVIIKGTTTGVVTGSNGEFVISCPANAILVFSAISYVTKEVAVNGNTTINVVLVDDENYPIFYGSYSPWAYNGHEKSFLYKGREATLLLYYGA